MNLEFQTVCLNNYLDVWRNRLHCHNDIDLIGMLIRGYKRATNIPAMRLYCNNDITLIGMLLCGYKRATNIPAMRLYCNNDTALLRM